MFSALFVVDSVAKALTRIKQEDGLTDADLGRVLGKSEDMAAKYRAGLTEMGIVSYAAAKREWGSRFSGELDRLIEETRPGMVNDQAGQTAILQAVLVMSTALEDGEITVEEVRDNRAAFEAARDAIDAQLGKLRPAA